MLNIDDSAAMFDYSKIETLLEDYQAHFNDCHSDPNNLLFVSYQRLSGPEIAYCVELFNESGWGNVVISNNQSIKGHAPQCIIHLRNRMPTLTSKG